MASQEGLSSMQLVGQSISDELGFCYHNVVLVKETFASLK
jgi:hypothetical protein